MKRFFTKFISSILVVAFIVTQNTAIGYAGHKTSRPAQNLRQTSVAQAGGSVLKEMENGFDPSGKSNTAGISAKSVGNALDFLRSIRDFNARRVTVFCGSDDKNINRKDFFGINSARYTNKEVLERFLTDETIRQLLIDVCQTEFIGQLAKNVAIDLKVLHEILSKQLENYYELSKTERTELLEDMLPGVLLRIQATDGWRRKVREDTEDAIEYYKDLKEVCPRNFEKMGFSIGCWTRELLLETNIINEEESIRIVVGYDPRDPDRFLTEPLIEGLRLAGVDIIDIGISATPATPMYMLHIGAHAAVEITASHNRGLVPVPTDKSRGQNGLKFFVSNGSKLYPQDEEEITGIYAAVHGEDIDKIAKKNGWKKGAYDNTQREEFKKFILAVHSDPINSWMMDGFDDDGNPIAIKEAFDERDIIFIDGARGAWASTLTEEQTKNIEDVKVTEGDGLVLNIFKQLGPKATIVEFADTRDDGSGYVNYLSGAVFVEGFRNSEGKSDTITRRDFAPKGQLREGYEAIRNMFKIVDGEIEIVNGRVAVVPPERRRHKRLRTLIQEGKKRVMCVLFDADGDRYIRLDYNPWGRQDSVIISSGDEASVHQATYLLDEQMSPFRNAPYNFKGTVAVATPESDIAGIKRHFENNLGLQLEIRAVGDKWILLQANLRRLKAAVEIIKNLLGEAVSNYSEEIKDVEDNLLSLGLNAGPEYFSEISTRRMLMLEVKIRQLASKAKISQKDIIDKLRIPGASDFCIGFEQTGHTVSKAMIPLKTGGEMVVYVGNGLKAAVNDLISVPLPKRDFEQPQKDYEGKIRSYYEFLREPFSRGYSTSRSVHFTTRPLLNRYKSRRTNRLISSAVFDHLRFELMGNEDMGELGIIQRSFFELGNERKVKVTDKIEVLDLPMLFLEIWEKVVNDKGNWEDRLIGSVFLRNSGTEIKTVGYVRGTVEDEAILEHIASEMGNYIALAMKEKHTPEVMAQHEMLEILSKKPCSKEELIRQLKIRLEGLDIKPEEVNLEDVITYSLEKERLIERLGDTKLNLGPHSEWFFDIFVHASAVGLNRLQAIERTVTAEEGLLNGRLTPAHLYGITVKEKAAPALIATIKDEIKREEIPIDPNGLLKGLVGKTIKVTGVSNGYAHVLAPNIVVFVETEGTLKGDLSGLVNLQKLTEGLIERVVRDIRQDDIKNGHLSNEQVKELVDNVFLLLNSFNIWTDGSGSREKEVAKESKATITLRTGNSFIAETIQQAAILTAFNRIDTEGFIKSWQPGQDVEINEGKEGIVIQNACDRIDLITNPEVAVNIRRSAHQYGMTMVGTAMDIETLTDDQTQSLGWIIFDKQTGKVVDFAEKPTLEVLRQRAPEEKGYGVATSWHLFGILQSKMRQMGKRYASLYEKHMDFSMDLQEAILCRVLNETGEVDIEKSLKKWQIRRQENKRPQYTETEWDDVWRAAYDLFPEGLGFVDAGPESIFYDTGAVDTLFGLMQSFGKDTELGEILRRKYGLHQQWLADGGRLIVRSKCPKDIVEPGAVVINASVRSKKSSRIAGVASDVKVNRLILPIDSWANSLYRPKEDVIVGEHEFVTDWQAVPGRVVEVRTNLREGSLKKTGRWDEKMFADDTLTIGELDGLLDVDARIKQLRGIRAGLPTGPAATGREGSVIARATGDLFERVGAGKFITTRYATISNRELTLPNFAILSAEGDGAEIRIEKGVVFEPHCMVSAENGRRVQIGESACLLKNAQICDGNVTIGKGVQVDAVVTGDTIIGDGTIFQRGSGTAVINSCLMPAISRTLAPDGSVETKVVPTVVNLTTNITNTVAWGAMFFQDVQVRDSIHYFSLMGGHVQTARAVIMGLSGNDRTSAGHYNALLDLLSLPLVNRLDISSQNERKVLLQQLMAIRFGAITNQEIVDGHHVRPLVSLEVILDGQTHSLLAGASNFGAGATTSNFSSRTELVSPSIVWGRGNFGVGTIMTSPIEIGPEALVANNATVSGLQAIEPGTLMLPQGTTFQQAIKKDYIIAHRMRLGDGVSNDVAIFTQAMYLYEVLIKTSIEGIRCAQTGLERKAYEREMKLLHSLFNGLLDNFKGYLALIEPSVNNLEGDYADVAEKPARLAEQKQVLGKMAEITQAIADTNETVSQAVQGATTIKKEAIAAKVKEVGLAALVIDENPEVRNGLELRLMHEWGIDVVLKAATPEEAQEVVEEAIAQGRLSSIEKLALVINNTEQPVSFEGITPVITPLELNAPDEVVGELLENV